MFPIQPTEDLYQGPSQAKMNSTPASTQPKSKPSLGVLVILAIPFILVFSIFGFLLKILSNLTGRSSL